MKKISCIILMLICFISSGFAKSDIPAVSVQKVKKQRNIAILNFKINSAGAIGYLSAAIPDMVLPVLLSPNLTIVERSRLSDAMEQMKLSMSGIVSERDALGLGKIVGASEIVLGSITTIKNDISIDARIIDVETGAIKAAMKERGTGEENIMKMIDNLAVKLKAYFDGDDIPKTKMFKAKGGFEINLNTGNIEISNGGFKVYIDDIYIGDSQKNKKLDSKDKNGKDVTLYLYEYSGEYDCGIYTVKIEWQRNIPGAFGTKTRTFSKEWNNVSISNKNYQNLQHNL